MLLVQVAALLSRYLEYVGGKEDDVNAKIIRDSLEVRYSTLFNLDGSGQC